MRRERRFRRERRRDRKIKRDAPGRSDKLSALAWAHTRGRMSEEPMEEDWERERTRVRVGEEGSVP